MGYRQIVTDLVHGAELHKTGVRYKLVVRPNEYALLINSEQFNALPEANRLEATAKISGLMLQVRALGVNFFLEASSGKI